MLHAIFAVPCLTTFCRLDELGLEAVGQRLDPDQAVIECRVAEPDPWCRKTYVMGELDRLTKVPGLNKIPGLERATPVLKKIPIAGTALTGGSIAIDVASGKDQTTAVVSNVGGLATGAVVGGLIGGPVGAAAGFLVSTGTGWAIENLMDPETQAIIEQLNSPEVQEDLPWYMRNPFA